MAQGLRNERTQRRRRAWTSVWKWLGAIALLTVVAVYAFKSGARFAETDLAADLAELDGLRQEVARLNQENEALRGAVATAQTEASSAAQQRIAELENALESQTARLQQLDQGLGGGQGSTGGGNRLFDALQKKLDAGVDAAQILAAVEGLRPPAEQPERVCDRESVTKRFQVQVPTNPGEGQNRITFENGRLRVTATAAAAVDASGREDIFYDPANPVTVIFSHRNGFSQEVTGVLPITHTLTIGGVDEQFVIEENVQGFIQVTGGRCRFR
jgi:hypothetical protein